MCPGCLQWEQTRLFDFFFARSGLMSGHVRVLCPTSPHWLQILLPSDLGFRSLCSRRNAPSGLMLGQVRELCPLSPQDEQARVNRFCSLNCRLIADSGFCSGHVLTLCPRLPQDAQRLIHSLFLRMYYSIYDAIVFLLFIDYWRVHLTVD